MDIIYGASRKKYRVRVVGYDSATGKHRVDSRLEARQGKALVENVDINAMYAWGLATRVSAPEAGGGETAAASASGTHGRSAKRPFTTPSRAVKRHAALEKHTSKGSKGGFGADVIGSVVDITYADPPTTYRLAVKSFDERTGLHMVDSAGFSDWDGEPFVDTIDLNSMSSLGRIQFVRKDKPGPHAELATGDRPGVGKGPERQALHADRCDADVAEGFPGQGQLEPDDPTARGSEGTAPNTLQITSATEKGHTGPDEGALGDSLLADSPETAASVEPAVCLQSPTDEAVGSSAKEATSAVEALAAVHGPQGFMMLELTPASDAPAALPLSADLEVNESHPESPGISSAAQSGTEGPPVTSSLSSLGSLSGKMALPSAEALQQTVEASSSKERAPAEQKEGVAARVARITQEMRQAKAKERNESLG
jgi:hypothetical protein